MAERNGTAIGVNVWRVICHAKLAQHRKALRRKRFIEFDQIKIGDFKPQPRHQLLRGGHRAHAHDARRNSRHSHSADPRHRHQPIGIAGGA